MNTHSYHYSYSYIDLKDYDKSYEILTVKMFDIEKMEMNMASASTMNLVDYCNTGCSFLFGGIL